MNQWICRIAMAGILIAATGGAVACSDDDGDRMTMAEYIAALNVVDDETTERIDALFAGITDENDVNQTRNAFSKLPDELERAAEAADDLNPPTEAQAKHDALVKALNEFADATQDSADAAADATSVEEYFAAVESDAYTAADEGFTAACLDMQNLAKDNGITVDLGCGGDEDESTAAEQTIRDVAAAWNEKDIEAFAALFTDAGLSSAFGDGEDVPRAEILAGLGEAIGEGALDIREISAEPSETGADVTVLWVSGKVLEQFRFSLINEADTWKVNAQEDLAVELPEGSGHGRASTCKSSHSGWTRTRFPRVARSPSLRKTSERRRTTWCWQRSRRTRSSRNS